MSVLVLGLGNRLMMDDGVGVAVVEALAARGRAAGGGAVLEAPPPAASAVRPVRYAVGETDWACCLALAEEAAYLIVVDAVVMGRRPGTVTVLSLRALWQDGGEGLSLHDLHFLDLLRQERPGQEGVLVGIEPYAIELGLGLSGPLAAALPEIVREIERVLKGL